MDHLSDTEKLKKWEVTLAKDTAFITQGNPSDAMYILLRGDVEVSVSGTVVGYISKQGTYIGEISFLLADQYTATCATLSQSTLIKISSDHIEEFIKLSSPVILDRLAKQMAQRIFEVDSELVKIENKLTATENKGRSPIYKVSKYKGREWLVDESDQFSKKQVHLETGEILLTEGSPPLFFFILKQGEILVSKKGKEINRVTEPGECFGEVGFILDRMRSATCTAIKPSDLIRLDKEDYLSIIQSHSTLSKFVLSSIARRLVVLSEKLVSRRTDYRK